MSEVTLVGRHLGGYEILSLLGGWMRRSARAVAPFSWTLTRLCSRWTLGIALGMDRRFEEAVSTLEAAAAVSQRHSLALTALAGVLCAWGKPAEALALHGELTERASRGYVAASHLALTAEAAFMTRP